jgi:hypothetical protein
VDRPRPACYELPPKSTTLDVLSHVLDLDSTAAIWGTIKAMFSLQSNTNKNNMMVA